MDKRPILNKDLSAEDFRDFYWLKKELIQFCQLKGLSRSGNKTVIANRIAYYLETGKQLASEIPVGKSREVIKSVFNWNTALLSLDTLITDNYKNTENVRFFFVKNLGKRFKFNVQFMNWMKSNEGRTLENAIETWQRITEEKKCNKAPKVIAPQFEYNNYLRDFLADNPDKNRQIGIKLWAIKKSMRGDNKYAKSDLKLLGNDND